MSEPSDVTVLSAADIPAYEGPYEIPGIRFRHARQALGLSAWGMNVLDLAPHCTDYPEHDHAADGQEEVYVVLSGAVTLQTAEGVHELVEGDMARVGPSVTRKLVTGDAPARILALGATPGQAFVPRM